MTQSLQIAPRFVTAFALLITTIVHFMISTFFEIPGNFFDLKFESSMPTLRIVYFIIAVLSTILFPMIVRKLSLKYTLVGSLICDMLGLAFMWFSMLVGGSLPLIAIGNVFMGAAFLTVCISIITYLVLEFPKKLGAILMAVFAFGDIGDILANLLFDVFSTPLGQHGFFLFSMALLAALIWFIAFKLFDPVFPKHLEKLRKGSLIWRELHYRLAFFLIAAIGYGVIESVFSVWGEVYLLQYLPTDLSTTAVSCFWFTMLIGKFILLIPLYYFPGSRIFPLLIIGTIASIIYIEHQTKLLGFVMGFGAAGLALSAVLPIIIASMERELISTSSLSHHRNYLPYVEVGTALIIGAHYMGVGLMAYYVEHTSAIAPQKFFQWAIFISALIGLITMFLSWSSSLDDKKST